MSPLIRLLLAAFVLASIVYVVLDETGVECKVCLSFEGRQDCETTSAPDKNRAIADARNAICTRVSSGMTDGIRCNDTIPLSLTCSE